jgi:hypothetical protein
MEQLAEGYTASHPLPSYLHFAEVIIRRPGIVLLSNPNRKVLEEPPFSLIKIYLPLSSVFSPPSLFLSTPIFEATHREVSQIIPKHIQAAYSIMPLNSLKWMDFHSVMLHANYNRLNHQPMM